MTKKMKDSGIEWVGEIPEDWLLVKYKRFAKSGMGVTLLKSDLLDRETADSIPVYSATQGNEFFGYTENKKLLLECGDLVIPARGNSIGHIKVVDKTATSTQTTIYSKVFSNEINIMFLKYCSDGLKDNWFKFDDTAIPQITVNQVNNNPVPYPSLKEQEKIVKILNKITQKVDNILKQTQQSIKELKNYKQSLITESVTKGLDPNVEMKDSSIEWIDNIPIHWDIRSIGNHYLQVKNKNLLSQEENLLSLSYGKIVKRNYHSADGLLPANFNNYIIVEPNDIVLRMTDLQNDHKSLRTGFVNESGIITSAYITLRPKKNQEFISKFVQLFLHSFDIYKGFYGMGSGVRQNVTFNDIKKLKIILPPIIEQKQIIRYLENKVSTIDNLIENKIKVIEELENYKKSLIYEYVTGKKEV
ncbi:restriction endonuclease subunit S [Staphylococcus epidermidis]|uniref:restriction endonuclease subunit S n=1 Tax=Staphylococcus epidermidis TaxID=1282 RepID=UPI002175AF05|nr:restriction endonuclease subunit S [Staphylococcus epidermidis]